MKSLIPLLVLVSIFGEPVYSGPDEEQLAKLLNQYPKADTTGDGVLSVKEATAHRAGVQNAKRSRRGIRTDFKVHPGWKADRFPEHAMCYCTPEELKAIYPNIVSHGEPKGGSLRIVGTGHSFMEPGYKALPAICRAAGFEQPLHTHTSGGMKGSARYKMGGGERNFSIRWQAQTEAAGIDRKCSVGCDDVGAIL